MSIEKDFATGLFQILYLDAEWLVPLIITYKKINDTKEVDNRFYYYLRIININ